MQGSTLILLLAMIGQHPGPLTSPAYSTPLASKPTAESAAARRWIDVASPVDGHPMRIAGWLEGGRPHFDPAEYPQLVTPHNLAPASPPRPANPAPASTAASLPPGGVITSKFPSVQAGHSWQGGKVGSVFEADKGPEKPDVFVTVMSGDKAERQRIMEQFRVDPQLASLVQTMGGRLALSQWPASSPMVNDVGLPDGGKPDIVVQAADGLETYRVHSYEGPQPLADAIRKADPMYHPRRDDAGSGGGANVFGLALLGVGTFVCIQAFFKLATRKGPP